MAFHSSVTDLDAECAQVYTYIVAKNVDSLKTALPTFKTNIENLQANMDSLDADSKERARVILTPCIANYTMGYNLVNPTPAS